MGLVAYHIKNIVLFIIFFFLIEIAIKQIGGLPDYNQIWAIGMGVGALVVLTILANLLDLPPIAGTLTIYTASAVGVLLTNGGVISPEIFNWVVGQIFLVIISYFVFIIILSPKDASENL